MDDERKDKQNDDSILDGLGKSAKKDNKSKFKMMAKVMAIKAALSLLLIIFIASSIWAIFMAIIHILDLEGDHNITSQGSAELLKEKVTIDKSFDGRYYFKIDKETKKEYLVKLNKAFYEGYWYDTHPDLEDKPEYVHDEDNLKVEETEIIDWFKTKNYEPYLIKMIRAEIASSYPKLGDYEGEDDPKSEKNRELGNKIDPDGNYVAQGRTIIQRTKMGLDGTPAANQIDL